MGYTNESFKLDRCWYKT